MKIKLESFIFFLINIIFISSSMDTFLNIKLGGFSLRFVFVPIVILIIISTLYVIKNGSSARLKFLGIIPALIWLFFLVLFIPNTSIIVRNIAYVMWLFIYFAFIPVVSLYIKNEFQLIKLVKYYIQSFFVVSIFCIVQFLLGLFKINLLVQQWWLNGLPRASGFSYEPSYLATYMLLGWVTCFYLIISKSQYIKYLRVNISIIFISLAIVLSGSRMGILFIIAIPLFFIIYSIKSLFIKFQISKLALRYFLIISLTISGSVVYFTYHFDQAIVFLNGVGLFGTVNHSYKVRTSDQDATFQAFKNSPIIGYSLGGIPTQIALIKQNKSITTQNEAKDFEGVNTYLEVLAASGFFGFIFFAYYFYLLFKKNLNISKIIRSFNPEFYKVVMAILLAFFCELIILIFNQNILRAYLWVHIAILNCIFYVMVTMLHNHTNQHPKLHED